jgi:site-specific DNA-methyltransferase (adenine-specific)
MSAPTTSESTQDAARAHGSSLQRLVGRHGLTATLYHADCLDVLPLACDAVVTDPPYGVSADKDNAHSSIRDNARWPESQWDKQRPSDEALRMLPTLADIVAIWGGNYFADCLPPSGGWLVWRKPEAETGFSLADAELCWTSKSFAARMRTYPRRDGNEHPTQKPVVVMAWTLEQLKVPQGATVLDPYMGSGTTGLACLRTGRNFIGIERDAAHYKTACDRIAHELDGALL